MGLTRHSRNAARRPDDKPDPPEQFDRPRRRRAVDAVLLAQGGARRQSATRWIPSAANVGEHAVQDAPVRRALIRVHVQFSLRQRGYPTTFRPRAQCRYASPACRSWPVQKVRVRRYGGRAPAVPCVSKLRPAGGSGRVLRRPAVPLIVAVAPNLHPGPDVAGGRHPTPVEVRVVDEDHPSWCSPRRCTADRPAVNGHEVGVHRSAPEASGQTKTYLVQSPAARTPSVELARAGRTVRLPLNETAGLGPALTDLLRAAGVRP